MTQDERLRNEFLKYGELEDPAAQSGFLASLRASDPQLAARLERLIAAASVDDSFLEVPAVRSWRKLLAESGQRRQQAESDIAQLMTQLQGLGPGELRFGPYELRRLVKTSTEAIVFEGYDPQVQRRVALKCLMPASIEDPSRRDRILSEARSLARVQDPHVLGVLAVLEQQDLRAILLPWIQGPTLESLFDQPEPIGTERAIGIGLGLIQGVTAVHHAGILHRDLKPANIVLDEKVDRPVIVDFGLACDDSDPDEVMLLCGTPQAMAPELILGGRPSAVTDCFALGCVLYQLFTRVRPFQGDSIEQVFQQILESEPAAAARWNPEIPIAVERALLQLLAKTPEARSESLGAMRQALESWRSQLASPTTPVPNSSVVSSSTYRFRLTRRGVLMSSVAAGAVAAISGWSWLQFQVPVYRPAVQRSPPSRPPDQVLRWSPDPNDPALVSVTNAAVTYEKIEDQTFYWRPEKPGIWTEIIYRIPVPEAIDQEFIGLLAEIAVFGMLDLSAQSELFLRGLDDTRWQRVTSLGAKVPELQVAGKDLDVTDLCQRTGGIEVRARLYANRELNNPPENYIGPSSAQFLRDRKNENSEVGGLQLRLWERR